MANQVKTYTSADDGITKNTSKNNSIHIVICHIFCNIVDIT